MISEKYKISLQSLQSKNSAYNCEKCTPEKKEEIKYGRNNQN